MDIERLKTVLAPYNPWWIDGTNWESSLPEYRRPIVAEVLSDLRDLPQAISITGPRRVGKSTAVRHVISHLISSDGIDPKRVLYFSFDDPEVFASAESQKVIFDLLVERFTVKGKNTYFFLDEIQMLPDSKFRRAFASLSPAAYDDTTRATLDAAAQSRRLLHGRMHKVRSVIASEGDAAHDRAAGSRVMLAYNGSLSDLGPSAGGQDAARKGCGAWMDGYGQFGNDNGSDGFTGFDYQTAGTVIGYDCRLTGNMTGGMSIHFENTDIDLDDSLGSGSIRSIGGSVYGSYLAGQSYLEGALSWAHQAYDMKRYVEVGGLTRTAHSDHDGNAFSASIGTGRDFDVKAWQLGPFGNLQFVSLDEEGLHESGAGAANLNVSARTTQSLASELGLRAARPVDTGAGTLIPDLTVAWLHDFGIDDRTISASLTGAPGSSFSVRGQDADSNSASLTGAPGSSFSVRGQDADSNGISLGAGFTLLRTGGLSMGLRFDAEFRGGYNAHSIQAGLRYDF